MIQQGWLYYIFVSSLFVPPLNLTLTNKIHYAIHGETAAEVIYHRADAEKEFMGLTTFSGNYPTLKEAKVVKNY